MRKIFLFDMITLDGFFEGPDHDLNWHNVDEEFNEFAIQQLTETDMLFFGRATYEMMAAYWSTHEAINDDPIVAKEMNTIPKIVFSKTLNNAHWENTRIIKENIKEEILQLKQQPSNDIGVFGSSILAQSLLTLGVIDEIRLMVNPVILGKGRPLFNGIEDKLSLKLLKTRTFANGNILLNYQVENKDII